MEPFFPFPAGADIPSVPVSESRSRFHGSSSIFQSRDASGLSSSLSPILKSFGAAEQAPPPPSCFTGDQCFAAGLAGQARREPAVGKVRV